MPKGVYVRTEWHKGRIKNKVQKGQRLSPETEFKKGQLVGKKNSKWKGGKCKHHGYILILQPDHPFATKLGYVREHRLIIEAQIGRYLKPEEAAHHLSKKDDNRPHLLMAFKNNGIHKQFESGKKIKPEEIIFDGRRLK